MNYIKFDHVELYRAAVTVIELDAAPAYELNDDTLSILSEDTEAISDILHANGIFMFEVDEVESERLPGEDMDGDHASGLASAGFGTDEDYEHNLIGDDE